MKIKTVFWDFDGVILDSMPIRDQGFIKLFSGYGEEALNKAMHFHNENAGLSRFVKIKHFYENILETCITEEKVQELAKGFSQLMRSELINPKYIIAETLGFIQANYQSYNFHIVSGSEQSELRFICEQHQLTHYFKTIEGSPTHKNDLVKNLMQQNNYQQEECILIGDSNTDLQAAKANNIRFYGYNNSRFKSDENYISTFVSFVLK